MFLVDEVLLENVFLAVLSFSPVSIILLLLYINLHFNNALIIRTSGRKLENLKKQLCYFGLWGASDSKVFSSFVLEIKCI